MRTPDWAASAGSWMLEQSHRGLLKLTGGRWPSRMMGMRTIELHTTGRKSGQRRSTMLTAPMADDERVIVVASKGGHSDHPDWYKNLAANPDIEITIDGQTNAWKARTASLDEKAELWPELTRRNRAYEGYQRNTDRDIPVVICERVR